MGSSDPGGGGGGGAAAWGGRGYVYDADAAEGAADSGIYPGG